jgi:2-oxo-4-hydroxy-4-carboxy-5-ureidoimidazoline decarboxylase
LTLAQLNALPDTEARAAFESCCGSTRWAMRMAGTRPFESVGLLQATAEDIWRSLEPRDWREAFSHHPRIGDRSVTGVAKSEQSGADSAGARTLRELASYNRLYEEKFGFVFLIFASGKSAEEMLEALQVRIHNREDIEMRNAMQEQAKITRLRLEKLLS